MVLLTYKDFMSQDWIERWCLFSQQFNMPVLAAQCTCYIDDYKLTVGCGATKKDAKRNAAEKAMKLLWKHHLEERQEEEDEGIHSLDCSTVQIVLQV